jgi:hypothetical protein
MEVKIGGSYLHWKPSPVSYLATSNLKYDANFAFVKQFLSHPRRAM